jgi:predicted glycoside hydrolase/deacetylase ChbG (UPF0249 family)
VTTGRALIVNADDFGRSPGINRGVVRAHTEGIVTSASLMVRYDDAIGAAAAARENPTLAVGLHVDMAEWELRDGLWHASYEVVPSGTRAELEAEVLRQLDRFRELMGRDPTHLDSHQHVHRDEPLRSVVTEVAAHLGVPLRHSASIRYCGAFYGQGRHGTSMPEALAPAALATLIRDLPDGITELCCHPSESVDFPSSYATERLLELRALCDPSARRAIEEAGVRLCSFADVSIG